MNIKISQDNWEFECLINIAKNSNVMRYLEIGARYGGSFSLMARNLSKEGKYIALELPNGAFGTKKSKERLIYTVDKLMEEGWNNSEIIWGNSSSKDIVSKIAQRKKLDLIFVDGDHRYKYVLKDYLNYRNQTRIMAFHDINCSTMEKDRKGNKVGVAYLWKELKEKHKYIEILYKASSKSSSSSSSSSFNSDFIIGTLIGSHFLA